MDYQKRTKLIPGQISKFVHDSGQTKSRIGLRLEPGLPSGSPVTTEMILRQVYNQLILHETVSPTSSQETATIANDVLPNQAFKRAWVEYKRLRHQMVRSYRAAVQRWLQARNLQRDRIIHALRSKVIYRKWSFFQIRFRADPGTDPGVEREETRGWLPMGLASDILNAAEVVRKTKSYRSGKTVRGRLVNFLAHQVGYSSYIHARQVSLTYLKANSGGPYMWVLEKPLVTRVKQRRLTLSRGKIRYAKSDLYAGLSLWYLTNPRPTRPGDNPRLVQLRKEMTEAIMFHHMSRTRQGLFTLAERRLISVECDVAALRRNFIPLGDVPLPGCHFAEFTYYVNSSPKDRHRLTMGNHRDSVTIQSSPDVLSRTIYLPTRPLPTVRFNRYIKPDGAVSDSSDMVTFGDFSAHRLAGLSGQILDLATYNVSIDTFNLLRSTLELKDLPDTFKVLSKLDGRISDFRLQRMLEGRFGRRAVSRVTSGKLRLLSGLKLAIACHLSHKFGVEPTMQDVNTVLQNGQDWAISMKRSVRQLLAGMEDLASSLTLRRSMRIDGFARRLPETVSISDPGLVPWERYIGAQVGSVKYNFMADPVDPPQWLRIRDIEAPENWDLHALYGDPRRFELGFYRWIETMSRTNPLVEDLGLLHVSTIDRSSRFFMRLKAQAILDALNYDQWSSWLEDLAPLEVAWELTSLSFITDWFTNSRRIISNLQRKLQILNERFDVGEQGIWYTLQIDHGIVDLQELPKRLSDHTRLHIRPNLSWSEFALGYHWGYSDPCDPRLPQFGDFGSAYCWSGYQILKAQLAGPDIDDIREAMREGLTVYKIGSSTLRTNAAIPKLWESAVPAFQLRISLDKLVTLSELILNSFR